MTDLLIILSVYLQACDPNILLNIHLLLRIACTIPVTSADNERSNSTLKLVECCLRTTMTTERLSCLAVISIQYEKPVDYDAIVQNLPNNNLVECYSLTPFLRNLTRDFLEHIK